MAYTKTPWVDGTTPVNAANLNKIEQGVADTDAAAAAAASAAALKIPLTEKAAVNGVATLGADGKVPAGQLPAMGADLSYDGDWAAGTYQDGDVVVKDGIAYLCVGGPTTVAPDPTAWGPAAGYVKPTYGPSFPAGPYSDGQEHILCDSATNPTYQWRFRYNAGSSSAYKWEFVGGAPVFREDVAGVTGITTTTYANANSPANFTVPRPGDYDWMLSAQLSINTIGSVITLAMKLGAAAVSDDNAILFQTRGAGDHAVPAKQRRATGLSAGDLLTPWVKVSANTGLFLRANLSVVPVRVA